MKRFLNRQNIILFFMVIAILYGLYDFVIQSHARMVPVDEGEKISEINGMIQQISNDLKQNPQSARSKCLAIKAETGWFRDPFCDRKSYQDWKTSTSKTNVPIPGNASVAPTFSYSGYMEDKKTKIAIINGMEYTVGESLDIAGYRLHTVSASEVVIEDKNSHKLFEVPFQE